MKEPLEQFVHDISERGIWFGDEFSEFTMTVKDDEEIPAACVARILEPDNLPWREKLWSPKKVTHEMISSVEGFYPLSKLEAIRFLMDNVNQLAGFGSLLVIIIKDGGYITCDRTIPTGPPCLHFHKEDFKWCWSSSDFISKM